MAEHQRPWSQTPYESAPSARQAAKFVTAAAIGVALLAVSGLILTGTVIELVLATPILVLFSPVLVPAGITLLLITAGLLFSGSCGVAAVAALSWIYRYTAGKHPPGADRLDYVRMRIADKARDVSDYVQHRAHEATVYGS